MNVLLEIDVVGHEFEWRINQTILFNIRTNLNSTTSLQIECNWTVKS